MVSSSAVVVWKRSEIVSRLVGVPATFRREAPVFEPPLKGSGGGRQPVLRRGASGLTVDGYNPR